MISLREGTINLIHGILKMSKLLIMGLGVNQLLDQPQNLSQIMVITGHVTNPRNGNGDPVIMLNMGIQEIILVNKC